MNEFTLCTEVRVEEDILENEDDFESADPGSDVMMHTVDGQVFHLEMYDEETMTYVGWVETDEGPMAAEFSLGDLADVL